MSNGPGQLPQEVALRVAKAIGGVEAILVGGQAVAFWGEVFSSAVPELAEYGPYTSKDVDFFGRREAAERLAQALGGKLFVPSLDDHTPNTALVRAEVAGYPVEVDFLGNILGIRDSDIRAVTLSVTVKTDAATAEFPLKVMHPVSCLISRVNSMLHPAIGRSDGFITRQITATFYVTRQYISHILEHHGDHSEAHSSLKRLHDFMIRDHYGKVAHERTPIDPLEILKFMLANAHLDPRYKEKTLSNMVRRIENKRAQRRLNSLSL